MFRDHLRPFKLQHCIMTALGIAFLGTLREFNWHWTSRELIFLLWCHIISYLLFPHSRYACSLIYFPASTDEVSFCYGVFCCSINLTQWMKMNVPEKKYQTDGMGDVEKKRRKLQVALISSIVYSTKNWLTSNIKENKVVCPTSPSKCSAELNPERQVYLACLLTYGCASSKNSCSM